MASARRTGTNENISTYGDGTRDYTSLNAWEADTDDEQAYTRILEVYADSTFDDYIDANGATITGGGTIPRIIRPASGESPEFVSTTDAVIFFVRAPEIMSQVQDISARLDINSSSNRNAFQCTAIGCRSIGSANAGSGQANGFFVYGAVGYEDYLVALCAAKDNDDYGFVLYDNSIGAYGCVAMGNGGNNFRSASGSPVRKNCISNYYYDSGTFTDTTCFNMNGVATTVFEDYANDDLHISRDTKEAVIGTGTDLSADAAYAFDDDIDGETCGQEWNIGIDSFPENYTLEDITAKAFSSSVRLSDGSILVHVYGTDEIWRTTDEGDSFGASAYATLPDVTNGDAGNFLLTSSGTLLFGMDGMIFRSTDGGENWTKVATLDWAGLTSVLTDRIWNFFEDAGGDIYGSRYPKVASGATNRAANHPGEIVKSADDGQNWTTVWGGAHLGDQFDESGSSASLDSHDPDVGDASSWGGDASGMTVGDGTGSVTKDASGLGITVNSTSPRATPSADDQVVKARGKTGGATSSDRFGVIARATDRDNCYMACVEGDGYLRVYKRVSGSPTQLGSSAAISGFSASTAYDVVLAVHGTTVEASINDFDYSVSVTDSAHDSGDTGIMLEDTSAEIQAVCGAAYPGGEMYHIHGCGFNAHNDYAYFCLEGGIPITTSGMLRFDGANWTKITEGYQYTVVVSKDEDDKIYLGADTGEDTKIYYIDDNGSTTEDSQTEVLFADFQSKGYFQDMRMLSDGNLVCSTMSNSPDGDYAAIFCTHSTDWSSFEERAIQRSLSEQQGYTRITTGELTNFVIIANSQGYEQKVTSLTLTPFTLTGSRIADASRAWQAAEDAAVTGWDKSNPIIVAAMVEGAGTGTIQLRWRKDGEAWNLLSSSGELTWSGATDLVNDDAVATGEKGCTPIGGTSYVDGTEREGANGVSTVLSSGEYTEHQWAVDLSGATEGSLYEFDLYDSGRADSVGTLEASVSVGGTGIPIFIHYYRQMMGVS